MTTQKTPHTQTQQNVTPEQTDLEPDEREYEADSAADQEIYSNMEGAESGENRTPRKIRTRSEQHRTEPETEAHEGSVTSRTPKRPAQGITSRTEEESSRQKKVVGERPDAQAGLNHSRRNQ